MRTAPGATERKSAVGVRGEEGRELSKQSRHAFARLGAEEEEHQEPHKNICGRGAPRGGEIAASGRRRGARGEKCSGI